MPINEFVQYARLQLTNILNESGAILYSATNTLRPGDYYFLGLNPGGHNGPSIDQCLNELPDNQSNAYVDEAWGDERHHLAQGAHPLQINANYLFEGLGTRIQDVCSSNLIFKRSPNQDGAGYPELAEICWPVHVCILTIVNPKTIITFGRQPFEFIVQKLAATRGPDRPSGHGNWVCRDAMINDKVRLIGLPHLSRYQLRGKDDVIRWIRNGE